jgi:hypothetical protein
MIQHQLVHLPGGIPPAEIHARPARPRSKVRFGGASSERDRGDSSLERHDARASSRDGRRFPDTHVGSKAPARGDPEAGHPAEFYGRQRTYAEQGIPLFCRVIMNDGSLADTCRLWNNGKCLAEFCPNSRLHLCSFCLSATHRKQDCTMQARSRVPTELEARQAADRRSVSRRR